MMADHGDGENLHTRATPVSPPEIAAISAAIGPDMVAPRAEDFIRAFETCRLTAYLDSAGKWTIGWGHTGPEIHAGLVWTQEQADQQFISDLSAKRRSLEGLLPAGLSDGMIVAIESLVYNIGTESFRTSHLRQMLLESNWLLAAKEFQRWDHIGSADSKGLLHRRLAEALVFVVSI